GVPEIFLAVVCRRPRVPDGGVVVVYAPRPEGPPPFDLEIPPPPDRLGELGLAGVQPPRNLVLQNRKGPRRQRQAPDRSAGGVIYAPEHALHIQPQARFAQ